MKERRNFLVFGSIIALIAFVLISGKENFFDKIFSPPTPDILKRAISNNRKIETFKGSLSFNLTSDKKNLISFKNKVFVYFTQENTALLSGKLVLDTGFLGQKANIEYIQKSDELYLKVNPNTNLQDWNLNRIVGDWTLVDLKNLKANYAARTDSQIREDLQRSVDQLIKQVKNKKASIRRLKDKKVSQEQFYQLEVRTDYTFFEELMGEFLTDKQREDLTKTLNDIKIVFLINKKTNYVQEFSLFSKAGNLDISLTCKNEEINNPKIKIETPSTNVVRYSDPRDLWVKIMPRSLKKSPLDYLIEEKEFLSNLIFYERFLHVLAILPIVI